MVKHTPYWFIYIFRGSNHHRMQKRNGGGPEDLYRVTQLLQLVL